MDKENASLNSCEGVDAESMGAKKSAPPGDSRSMPSDASDEALSNQRQAEAASTMYDPYTGVIVDNETGLAPSLDKNLIGEAAEKHHRASERLDKLTEPAADDSRIKVHGSTTSPFAAKNVGSEPASGDIRSRSLPVSAATMNILDRVVTAGLTETADLSVTDMAACAFGVVDTHTEPIVSVSSGNAKSLGGDITELPTTSTLLKKSHIIPDLLDSVEENSFFLEIAFGNFQVFNGIIMDREVMHQPPSVHIVERGGRSNSELPSLFLLLLVELEADGKDYLQWMVSRSNTTGIKHEDILEYRQMPSSTRDRVFLLFPTKQRWNKQELDAPDRSNFDVHDFVTRHDLGAAVAAVYFESETIW